METKDIWKKTCHSVCQILHYKNGRIIGVGTGFKVENLILTNNHVFASVHSDKTKIQFKDATGKAVALEKVYTPQELQSVFKEGMPQNSWDFAIVEDDHFNSIPNLELAEENEIEIGERCVFLGYPLQSNYLTIHQAIISAKYTNIKNDVKYIQLDASINRGNSGGPLIEAETQKVIGYITLKKTGLSPEFTDLSNALKDNIKALEGHGQTGGVKISGIDFVSSLRMVQSQLSLLGEEIERSSNVGIGYAFELDEVRKSLQY